MRSVDKIGRDTSSRRYFKFKLKDGLRLSITITECTTPVSFTDCFKEHLRKLYGIHSVAETPDALEIRKSIKISGILSFLLRKIIGEKVAREVPTQTEELIKENVICVILGDNIIERNIKCRADAFKVLGKGAKIFLKEVEDARRFGITEIENGKVTKIVEKPKEPKLSLAVSGICFYDNTLFQFIKELSSSYRVEIEATDINNLYLQPGEFTYDTLQCLWADTWTFEPLRRASNLVTQSGANKI